jgi:AcrR family transcriptional regulator
VRRQQVADTRERIVAAGAALVHRSPVWDWRALTVAAVAEEAGVDRRTVYRHFPSADELRDAVLQRLTEEAGVVLDGLRLGDVRPMTEQVFGFVSTFPIRARTERDATFEAVERRRREAVLVAVAEVTPDWSEGDRRIAAGLFDVLWSVVSYERLVGEWELDPDDAIRGFGWIVSLLEQAVREGRRPI